MRQRLRGRHRPAAAGVLRQQVGRGVGSRSVAAAVQRRGLAAHAQHAQGEEGLHLHVSVQRQPSSEKELQVGHSGRRS